jgi:hypothetical protein
MDWFPLWHGHVAAQTLSATFGFVKFGFRLCFRVISVLWNKKIHTK